MPELHEHGGSAPQRVATDTAYQAFNVPKGVPVHSSRTGRWEPAGRSYTVYPYSVNTYGDHGTVVRWAGAGGYWRSVRIMPNGEYVGTWP